MIWLLVIINLGGTTWQSPYAYRSQEVCQQAREVILSDTGSNQIRVACVPRPLATGGQQ